MAAEHKVLNGAGEVVERHTNARDAARAALIMSAHEIKNGRVGDYRTEPPHLYRWDELNLPDWALVALELKE